MELAYAAGKAGGLMPAALNAANEQAVALFLAEKIDFLGIPRIIEQVCDRASSQNNLNPTLEDIIECDRWARAAVLEAEKDLQDLIVS